MNAADKRQAVFLLHQEGMSLQEIAQRLQISRNTVHTIIAQKGEMPLGVRQDKIQIDGELLERLYQECEGWVQRVHEKLMEEQGIRVGYSTLTRMLRQLEMNRSQTSRCQHVPDQPGAEMQHDTSPYAVQLGDLRVQVIASLLYLRYSKRRYLRFYRLFNRFRMKCFLHEVTDVLEIRRSGMHYRQHQSGAMEGDRSRCGDSTRDGGLRQTVWIPVRMP